MTANETENYGNKFLAFKNYFMEELNDLKNRLEVLNNLGNASCSDETTAILKEEIDYLRKDNKNKSIIAYTKPTRERKITPLKQG